MKPNVAADKLKQYIDRIERLEVDKKNVSTDIKSVYLEAQADGFDTKVMRQVVRLRKMEKDARDEADMMLETYRNAIGI
ncbi:MAG: DUF2312 domain-containing protein [Cytophagales bacterium]|nr:DUF2312 domain-containing protein [Cytophagales bacterium]